MQIIQAIPVVLIFILLELSSCTGKENFVPDNLQYYTLEFQEEFFIHSLSTVEILDYYPKDKLFLGYTNSLKGKEICLIDEEGKIILQSYKQGEGPEEYSSNLSCLGFTSKGEIMAMTSVQVLLYDQSLKLLERQNYTPSNAITLYSVAKKFDFINQNKALEDLIFPTIPSGVPVFQFGSASSFEDLHLLEIYELNKDQASDLFPVSDRSISKEAFGLMGTYYAPIYSLDPHNSILYLTGAFDQKLTLYDLKADTVVTTLDIFHGGRYAISPRSKIELSKLSKTPDGWPVLPKNLNIFRLDEGMIALEYLQEVSINPNLGNKNAEIKGDTFQSKLILLGSEGQVSRDIDMPIEGKIAASLPGNRFLIKAVNLDTEEDYTRYAIFKLAKV